MSLPSNIRVTEVCPRDGLQNIPRWIETEQKIRLITDIIDAGAEAVEVTSFVHPGLVPQFKDAAEVFQRTREHAAACGVELMALVPNLRGALNAHEAGVSILNYVVSASEEHNQRNVKKSVAQSLNELASIVQEAAAAEIRVSLACTFGSPFADEVTVDQVLRLCDTILSLGIRRMTLADTAGISTPIHTRRMLQGVKRLAGPECLSVHFHDTRGMGIANAYVALEEGITAFDTALGGLGGCPFIPGARGNIATEDFVHMVLEMGLKTRYDFQRLLTIASGLEQMTGQPIHSRMATCQLHPPKASHPSVCR